MPDVTRPIRRLADRHRRVAIDSNVLIYLLDDHPTLAEPAAALVDAVADGVLDGIVASVGVTETLVGAARADDGALFELAAATIQDLGLDVVTLDAEAAAEAAWIRGRTGASLPDAVHLACAARAGATAFVTNDRRLRPDRRLELVLLADLAEAAG
ncbi:MAG TPA: PIN domain-containing protein [Candidatus Limnocylindrales bacterium]|nr:PIN domain-containing protein [Candidatus Limnocylindrales bacterium]